MGKLRSAIFHRYGYQWFSGEEDYVLRSTVCMKNKEIQLKRFLVKTAGMGCGQSIPVNADYVIAEHLAASFYINHGFFMKPILVAYFSMPVSVIDESSISKEDKS